MRILITGAGGLVGGRLVSLVAAEHETTGLIRTAPAPEAIPSVAVDLRDPVAVAAVLDQVRPEAVIHCAALADAEACERDPDRAHRENVIATQTLAAVCRQREARLIALSTDLVFGGESLLSTEDSPAQPLSTYGRTKLLGEAAVVRECPTAVILRVSLVVGRGHGPRLTASESLAQRLGRGESVTLYDDEWRSPVDPESVAQAILALLRRPHLRGRFHLGGAERITRADLGDRVAQTLNLDPTLIQRTAQSTHPGAKRPRDVSLGIDRAREELDYAPRDLETAIREGRRG